MRSAVGEVHERYRIVANLGIGEVSVPALQLNLGETQATGVAQVSAAFGLHLEKELLAGGVGAGAGAAIGTVLLPGVGTVIGGLLGGVAGWLFSPGLGDLKAKVSAGCSSIAERTAHDTCELLQSLTNRIHERALTALRETLDDEVRRYNAWIDRVLAEEQRRIAAERAMLRDLLGRGQRIDAHAAEMTREVGEVARESSMMSRAPRVLN